MNGFIASVLLVAALVACAQAASVAKPTCGGTTSAKDINLIKPAIPPRTCEYKINAYNKYVCQLRIDFAMTLAQPTLQSSQGSRTAECLDDYFEVNGLRLCGVEVWQHIYVPFNATAGVSRIDLQIVLANRAGGSNLPVPEWNMVVTQLECPAGAAVRELPQFEEVRQLRATSDSDGFLVAPPGCLQYFPQAKGVVKSFNYNDGDGVYPSNLNYAICFRRTTSTTALTIRAYSFNVGDYYGKTLLTDNTCFNGIGSGAFKADYLMVPQARIVESEERATYFCGQITKDVVISSNNPGPLFVLFNSDETYEADKSGFAFTYTVQ